MSETLVVIFFVLVVIAASIIFLAPRWRVQTLAYYKLDALVTPAERSFYGVLLSVVGDRIQVFAKVRVADVISPVKGLSRGDRQRAFNRISAKHFDFVLCRPDDLSVVCVIELDDRSHSKRKVQIRDEFLEEACQSADVPLVRLSVKSGYTRAEIEDALLPLLEDTRPRQIKAPPVKGQQVNGHVKEAAEGRAVSPLPTLVVVPPITRVAECPNCGAELVKRRAKKGKNQGKMFLACASFPACRFVANA